MTFDVSASLAIDGWMSEEELQWLAEQASRRECIVEIGSWKGRSTLTLGLYTPGTVSAVDHWRGQELTPVPTSLDEELRTRGADKIYGEFVKNMRPIKDKILKWRMSSKEAATILHEMTASAPRLPCDMVFLDGEHAYEGVKADIALWSPLLVSGGLLCGHDWWHEGVQRAVKEAVAGYQVAPQTNIWWAIL